MSRFHSRTMAVAATTCLAALLTACDSTEKATTQPAMGAINDKCPVMNEPVDPSATTVSWGGKTVGFCCDMCVPKWNKMTAADKNAFIAAQ